MTKVEKKATRGDTVTNLYSVQIHPVVCPGHRQQL